MEASLLFVWLGLFAALLVLVIGNNRTSGALTLSYFLCLSLIHVPGMLPYVFQGPEMPYRPETVAGFQVTLIGMGAFIVGALAAQFVARGRRPPPPMRVEDRARLFDRFGWRAIWVGSFCYFVVLPVAARIPSLTALFSQLGALMVLGIWMRMYSATLDGNRTRMASSLAFVPLLPLSSLLASGIINYGVNWALSVVAYLFRVSRNRRFYVLAAPFAVFLGLSFFAVYMGERSAIRETVWEEKASIYDRLERTSQLVTDFRLLDLDNSLDRWVLSTRLNFNYFLGVGMKRLESGQVQLKYGGTVDPRALIPRAIWSDKPFEAGGGDLVTDFTGIYFDKSKISVGAGQVLEFYVNFALPGVIVGFLGLGFIFSWLDLNIGDALVSGNLRNLLLSGLPGLSMMSPGGNLLEIMIAVVAAYTTARILVSLPYFKASVPPRRSPRSPAPAPVRAGR